MYLSDRSSNWFPALIVGLGLAVALFYVRARFTRPEVPTPVKTALEHFAPGVTMATTVDENARHVANLHWTENVGFVGRPASRYFDEVRLVPRRRQGQPLPNDRGAKVASVELVAFHMAGLRRIMRDLAGVFDTTVFSEGCLDPVGDGYPHRQVRYMTTKRNLGGAAVINDWPVPAVDNDSARLVWSLVTWSGAFDGSATLHAPYVPVPCKLLVPR